MKNTGSMPNNKNVERLLHDMHRILVKMEEHLSVIKNSVQKEDVIKQLLNDLYISEVICLKRKFYYYQMI